MSAPTPRLEQIASLFQQLGPDEQRVLIRLAARLLEGQRAYGRLDLRKDPRDWRKERAEELTDALVYLAFEEVAEALPPLRAVPRDPGQKR